MQIGKGLFCVSPELLFAQMATELTFSRLIALGYELCGYYRLHRPQNDDAPNGYSELGFTYDPPLTTTDSLHHYLDGAPNVRGARIAKRTLSFISDESASPMESAVAMLLSLPRRAGGYGLPLPQMNGALLAGRYSRDAISQSHFYCDLFWPDANVAIEYDSDAFHLDKYALLHDASRRNSLLHMGVFVLTVTNKQVMSPKAFERVAFQLAKQLGSKVRTRDDAWWERHILLRKDLLPSICREL